MDLTQQFTQQINTGNILDYLKNLVTEAAGTAAAKFEPTVNVKLDIKKYIPYMLIIAAAFLYLLLTR